MESRERKDNRIGIVTSLGVHLGVLLLLFFVVAWKAPNPPLPEFGVELNFGTDDQGSGDVQPQTPVGDQAKENENPDQQQSEQQTEEIKTDNPEKKEAVPEESTEKIDSKLESDVAVKEEKKKTEVIKDETKPKDPNPEKKVLVEFKKDEKKDVNPSDKTKQGEQVSQGDDKNKTSDKGSPDGSYDPNGMYFGQKGGGGGGDGLLSMPGWIWDEKPVLPQLDDANNGKVSFEIVCDQDGVITKITTIEFGLSPKSIDKLKVAIMNSSLARASGSGKAPASSKGTIVFTLKNK